MKAIILAIIIATGSLSGVQAIQAQQTQVSDTTVENEQQLTPEEQQQLKDELLKEIEGLKE